MGADERIDYDEFGLFHENAEEFGLPYDGPPADIGVGPDERVVMYVGTIEEYQGLRLLAEAQQVLQQDHADRRIRIVEDVLRGIEPVSTGPVPDHRHGTRRHSLGDG